MGRFCHLKLLTLVLVLHNDVELASTDDVSPSWQCKGSAYCSNKQTPTSRGRSAEVTFTDWPRPATLAMGCLDRQVDLICCTANFVHISWQRRVNDSWIDFLSVDPDHRCLSEDNQTASIVDNLSREDEGMYRCVAYGHDGDVIHNEVKLVVQDCYNYHQPPTRTNLLKYVTEKVVPLGDSVDVPCNGFFGNVTLCFDCDIGWIRHPLDPFDLINFDVVNDSVSQRVYANKSTGGDQLVSTLHIKEVQNADYRGSYECWMLNQYGSANTSLVIFKPEPREVLPNPWRMPAIVCGSVVAFVAVLSVLLCSLRHDIRLAVRKRQRTPPDSEGLRYDVLLLHADSDENATNTLGGILHKDLTESSEPPYNVFCYRRNVQFGEDQLQAMANSLALSRCAVVVLCQTFVAEYNENWFFLENLIAEIDVIYILNRLDRTTVFQQEMLGPAIRDSMRNSRCLTWSWPTVDDEQLGCRDKRNINRFFCHLKLAIPNRRRRNVAPGADQPAAVAAAAAETRPESKTALLPATP